MTAYRPGPKALQEMADDIDKKIFDDILGAKIAMDSQPCKSEWYWDYKSQRHVKIKPDFKPKNLLASLLGRKK